MNLQPFYDWKAQWKHQGSNNPHWILGKQLENDVIKFYKKKLMFLG